MSIGVRLNQQNLKDLETIRRYLAHGKEGLIIVPTSKCLRFALNFAAEHIRCREFRNAEEQRKAEFNGESEARN